MPVSPGCHVSPADVRVGLGHQATFPPPPSRFRASRCGGFRCPARPLVTRIFHDALSQADRAGFPKRAAAGCDPARANFLAPQRASTETTSVTSRALTVAPVTWVSANPSRDSQLLVIVRSRSSARPQDESADQ